MSEAGMFDAVGRVLIELREEAGVQQKDVAERAGVSSASVSSYETGKHSPQLPTLGKILDALGVDAEEFGARVRAARTGRRSEVRDRPGGLPRETAVAASEALEDLAALLRLAIRQPAPVRRKRVETPEAEAAEEKGKVQESEAEEEAKAEQAEAPAEETSVGDR